MQGIVDQFNTSKQLPYQSDDERLFPPVRNLVIDQDTLNLKTALPFGYLPFDAEGNNQDFILHLSDLKCPFAKNEMALSRQIFEKAYCQSSKSQEVVDSTIKQVAGSYNLDLSTFYPKSSKIEVCARLAKFALAEYRNM